MTAPRRVAVVLVHQVVVPVHPTVVTVNTLTNIFNSEYIVLGWYRPGTMETRGDFGVVWWRYRGGNTRPRAGW